MWQDEIVEEVRKVRDRYAAGFNYDLEAIYQDIKEQEKDSQRKSVMLPAKKPELPPLEDKAAKNWDPGCR